MQPEDAPEFLALLNDIWMLKGTALLTDGQKALFFGALAQHPLNEVKAGLMAHVRDPRRGQFLPMPADVIAQIKGIGDDDGRPGAEEAWALVQRARDEAQTIVWTAEMAEAHGVARSLLAIRDEVGARMAFKETYQRLLAEARERRVPAIWTVSQGHDPQLRESAIAAHIAAGRPGLGMADVALPVLGLDKVLALPAPVDSTPEQIAAREAARAKAQQLREEFAARRDNPPLSAAEIESARQRARTEALKTESNNKVRQHGAEEGNQ
jgi:hypothetical protein